MKNRKSLFTGDIRQYAMVIALLAIALIFGVLTKGAIFNPMNVTNIILQNGYVILLSVGMFFCILTANVDLSVGSILAFSGAMLGVFIVKMGMNPWLAVILVLLIGIAIGIFQGFFIAKLDVPPFIATLAGELIWRGLTLVILAGHSLSPFPAQFQFIASGYLLENVKIGSANLFALIFAAVVYVVLILSEMRKRAKRTKYGFDNTPIGAVAVKMVFIFAVTGFIFFRLVTYRGIPIVLIILLAFLLLYDYIASSTILGRQVYAVGGNRSAAELSGVRTRRVMWLVYINSAFMAAVSGIIVVARLNAASPSAGTGFELDAIAACYIGGCAAAGGEGTVFGVVIGALVMGILNNGMSIMGIGSDFQKVVKGFILLAAITFDIYTKSKQRAGK